MPWRTPFKRKSRIKTMTKQTKDPKAASVRPMAKGWLGSTENCGPGGTRMSARRFMREVVAYRFVRRKASEATGGIRLLWALRLPSLRDGRFWARYRG